ncbi:hypothetical protein [Sandaracinus amylolyticus]|uniref:B box-type domain-containing protein n=1 Tax=Sandaracinus amylolyticus TaxID=927083 RepID=A0A0F6W2E6_9BACT|nr:hypothetical protein [Sandaracinus amylolyticus]AKF05762.1 hypothetical protein DB32_002911 [Sandaracinus amylolyticus]
MQIVACRNHPAREAIGVCVKCRARVCAECSTKIEGVNHCVECLATLAGNATDATQRAASSAWRGRVAAGVVLGGATLMWWALVEIALPR